MANGKGVQNCFSCKKSTEEARNYGCALHGFVIPRIGMDTICSDYESPTGVTISQELMDRIDSDGLYYYASVSFKWMFKLADFKELVNPWVGAFILFKWDNGVSTVGIRVAGGYVEDIGCDKALTVKTAKEESGAIARSARRGIEVLISLDDSNILRRWLDEEFYLEAILTALEKDYQTRQVLEKTGVPIILEIISEDTVRVRPNAVMLRELLGDLAMSRMK